MYGVFLFEMSSAGTKQRRGIRGYMKFFQPCVSQSAHADRFFRRKLGALSNQCDKLEFEGELSVAITPETRSAQSVREGGKRQKLHRAPQGMAPRQGAGSPREWAFEGGVEGGLTFRSIRSLRDCRC